MVRVQSEPGTYEIPAATGVFHFWDVRKKLEKLLNLGFTGLLGLKDTEKIGPCLSELGVTGDSCTGVW